MYVCIFTDIYGFLGGSVVKNSSASAGDVGDMGSIPGSRRFPGGGNGYPPTPVFLPGKFHGEAWRATVHRVAKNHTTE